MTKRYALLGMTLTLAIALAVPAMGGPSNPIANAAASAKTIAKKALKKAKQANTTAKAAQAAAAAAQSTANGAASSANGAKSAADAAQGSANAAQQTANGAKTAADAAQASANTAQTTADEAKTLANAAQATADSKFGTQTVEFGEATVSDSNGPKFAGASCGSDREPTGGGFATGGAGNNEVTPTSSIVYGNGWLVLADEIGAGTGSNWTLQANVVCLAP